MSSDRTRSTANLAPKTRSASEGLLRVCEAARALAAVPPPTGEGPGQLLIEREVDALRERIESLTTGSETLDQALRSPYRLLVVGPSQAGKSTLINVIAGHRVLPTTGAGDAKTLKETVLTYSSEGERTLRVQYISKGTANQRRFTLERYARKAPESAGAFLKPWNEKEPAAANGDDDTIDVANDENPDSAETARRELQRRYDTLVMQIKTLIYPEIRDPAKKAELPQADADSLENANMADWVDAWRLLLGQDTVAGGRFAELWTPRLAVAAERLGGATEIKESEVGEKGFRAVVNEHTAEGMAFLVDRVELALHSNDLEQIDVEDLPGVGNYGDPAADVARDVLTKAMRERDLDGLLVVTKNNGLDKETVGLVEEAAVLRRVLQGETDLAIAITHVDHIASAFAQHLEDQGMDDDEFPSNDEIMRTAAERACEPQRDRLIELLKKQTVDLETEEQTDRVNGVLDRTLVVGVDAWAAEQHHFDLRRRRKTFADTLDGTGVPDLLAHFTDRANSRHQERLDRACTTTIRIRESINADLQRLIRDHDVEEALQLAEAAREAYLDALRESQLPLSNRWATTRERAATKLEHAIPGQLTESQIKAQREASKRKRRVIYGCRNHYGRYYAVHWATMRAALRWGGTWDGARHLDLPGELADALMPALLRGWRELSDDVEALLTAYRAGAEHLLDSLDTAANEAATTAGLERNEAAIADSRRQLENDFDSAVTLLAAHVDLLNEHVPQRLRDLLKGHFEKECQRVLKENPLGGPPGYTERLIQGYDDIGEEAIEKGADAGTVFLQDAYAGLRQQVREALFDKDPVAEAYTRLIAGIHDAAEAPEVVEARRALVAWARDNLGWLYRAEQ